MAYIYTLSDPDTDEVRYIGQTINDPKLRLHGHIKASKDKRRKYHSVTWIRSILDRGKLPVVRTIRTVDLEYVDETEIFCIAEYKRLGCNLTNTTEGGGNSGYVYEKTPEIRSTISKSVKAHWESLDEESKKNHSDKFQKNAEAYRKKLAEEGLPHPATGNIPWNKGKKIGGEQVKQAWIDRRKNGFISQEEMCQEIAQAVGESKAKVHRALKGMSDKVAKDVVEKIWKYYLDNEEHYPELTVVYIDGSRPNTLRGYNKM